MSSFTDFEQQKQRRRAQQVVEDKLYGLDFLSVDAFVAKRELIGFVALATFIACVLTMWFAIRPSAVERYQALRRPKWAPGRTLVLGMLVIYAVSCTGLATVLALIRDERSDLMVMLAYTGAATITTLFVPSYLHVADLSLTATTLLMSLVSNGYHAYIMSDLFFLSAYLQLVTLVIVLYLFGIIMKQWIATELPIALRQMNISAPAQLQKVLDGKKGSGKRRPKMPPKP